MEEILLVATLPFALFMWYNTVYSKKESVTNGKSKGSGIKIFKGLS